MGGHWSEGELGRIGDAEELEIAVRLASDASPGRWVPIWVVRVDSGIYVRTWQRRDHGWFGRAVESGQARIRVPGLESDVIVDDIGGSDAALRGSVDTAYQDKYGRYGPVTVGRMVADAAAAASLRLTPTA